jgi:alpha-L-fucosidase 2
MGDVNLELGGSDLVEYDSYKRELDLHTATVRVTYSVGPVQYTREHFCSHPHQVIVTRIAASEPGHVSCTLSLSSQLKNTVTVTNANEVVMEGVCPGQRPPAGLQLRNSNSSDDVTTGIKFAAVLGVQMGGSEAKAAVLNDQNKLRLDTADWIVLVVAASSSFDGPFVSPSDSRLDPTSAAVATLNRARSLTYEQLKAAHLDDYQRLFHRVTLRLSPPGGGLQDAHGGLMMTGGKETMLKRGIGTDEGIIRTSADRVKSFATDEDPSLVELLFQYGRYLLISCSRPGTQVSNLQGIWSQDVAPAWE